MSFEEIGFFTTKVKPRNSLLRVSTPTFSYARLMKTQNSRKSHRKTTMHGITLLHSGTKLSCRITHNDSNTGLLVSFDTKITGPFRPDVKIQVRGKSEVDAFCPSIEGTVIWCQLVSGEQLFYDTRTGRRISDKKLQDRAAHFYA